MRTNGLEALERKLEAGLVWSVTILPIRTPASAQELHLLVFDRKTGSDVFVLRGKDASREARRRLAKRLADRGIPYEEHPVGIRRRTSA